MDYTDEVAKVNLADLRKHQKIALVSVFDKKNIEQRVQRLVNLGFGILSSGGTARTLTTADIPVCDVAELVGGGAILGHKVVTLSREVHAGLLADLSEQAELDKLGIPRIDLAAVDLYPLEAEIAKEDHTDASVVEKTDIGGPMMLRSAAKGHRIVIGCLEDWEPTLQWMEDGYSEMEQHLRAQAAKAEFIAAKYCLASARFLSFGGYDGVIERRVAECKYGENAWQTPAGLFSSDSGDPLALDRFELVAGDKPSYNNYLDGERLLQTVTHIAAAYDVNGYAVPKIAVAVKHGNPCGAATSAVESATLQDMVVGDTRAILGGLVMVNFEINEELAEILLTHWMPKGQRRMLDGIFAPAFTSGAIELLRRRGDKCRFLANDALADLTRDSLDQYERDRYVRGGHLHQPNYTFVLDMRESYITSYGAKASPNQLKDVLLAWAVGSTSNSNKIALLNDGFLIGNGTGQQDRVGAAKLAVTRATDAHHITDGATAYSDSFFPFPDGPEVLINAGVKAILTSSGSKMPGAGDAATIELCRDAGIVLWMIPDKIGRGFFGH